MNEKYPFSKSPEKMAKVMGEGRMSVEEKAEFLKEHGHEFFRNLDFVSIETYLEMFKGLDLEGKRLVDVGAGFSIAPKPPSKPSGEMYPMLHAIAEIDPHCTYIPVDYNHKRTKSWLLLDTNEPDKNNNMVIEPVTADATALPFKNESIDGYLSSNLINEPHDTKYFEDTDNEQVDFIHEVLQEAYRVLRPGGFVVVSSFGYTWWETEDKTRRYNDHIEAEDMVTSRQVEGFLARIGFKEIQRLPLSDKAIEVRVEEVKRLWETEKAGIEEACAFFARK